MMKYFLYLVGITGIFAQIECEVGYTLWQPYSYMADKAVVRAETSLCKGEVQYLSKRFAKNKSAIENMLQMQLADHEVPRIAFCCSGGGYRSMIEMAGYLMGAESFGLLDAATYISCISGSTWCVAPWISMDVSISEFRDSLVGRIQNGLFSYDILKNLALPLAKNCISKHLTIIDIYGALLGQVLLSGNKKNPHEMYLHTQLSNVESAKHIYPIYTAVIEELTALEWLEFTPHEVGADTLGGFIPSWALGRKFVSGFANESAEPPTLSYLLGLWGSAFKEYWKEFIHNQQRSVENSNFLNRSLLWPMLKLLGNIEVCSASIPNFTYQLFNDNLHHLQYLQLVDAGVYCNLPIIPLMRPERKVDIIIVLDASKDIENLHELRRAEFYAKVKGLNFPHINDLSADKRICTVFECTNTPIIIYMPCVKNKEYSDFDPHESISSNGYCHTTNFAYTKDQIYELSGLAEFNIKQSKDIILEVIRQVVREKSW